MNALNHYEMIQYAPVCHIWKIIIHWYYEKWHRIPYATLQIWDTLNITTMKVDNSLKIEITFYGKWILIFIEIFERRRGHDGENQSNSCALNYRVFYTLMILILKSFFTFRPVLIWLDIMTEIWLCHFPFWLWVGFANLTRAPFLLIRIHAKFCRCK